MLNGTNYAGLCEFKFALVNGVGNQTFWSHDGSSVGGSEPTGSPIVLEVTRGIFSVNLGDTAVPNMVQAIPACTFTNADVYLRIWAGDGIQEFQQLSPDRRLIPAPYASIAGSLSGTLSGDVTGTQEATVVSRVGGAAASTIAFGALAAVSAQSEAVPFGLVRRDGSGGFSSGPITGTFLGNGAGLTNLAGGFVTGTVARAADFSGALSGDVTGTQNATVVGSLGGIPTGTVVAGAQAANSAASGNVPSTIVRRDSSGNFAAGTITGTFLTGAFLGDGSGLTNVMGSSVAGSVARAIDFSGGLAGDVTGTQAATVVSTLGGVSADTVVFGAMAANLAASENVANGIVRRDANGDFSAGQVKGRFAGDGSGLTNLNAAHLIGSISEDMVESALPAGLMVVSVSAQDSGLVSKGFRLAMTVPAPAWANGATANAPSARSGHTAIWTGQEFIVWGGTIGLGMTVNSGGTWRPENDSWAAVSSDNAAAARTHHTGVWSGTEMLVWGGQGTNGFLRTGARFRPATQHWTSMATDNAPSERSGHIAIWTGSRMLIWGGQNDSGLLDDGALYDPGANQWTQLSLPNAPEPRVDATAVWTGDRLLVWGGEGTSGPLQSGAQLLFNPSGSPASWTSINDDSAPPSRRWHTAIWTGTRMIIWGGERGGLPLGDGAAYDPIANTWTTLSGTDAPAARFNHVSLWTGQEMLIVAGSNGSAELASGSAYDPLTGVWRPLSTSGNPQPRAEAAAAWTGSELVVFGGVTAGQPVAALQRLVPQPIWYFYRKL